MTSKYENDSKLEFGRETFCTFPSFGTCSRHCRTSGCHAQLSIQSLTSSWNEVRFEKKVAYKGYIWDILRWLPPDNDTIEVFSPFYTNLKMYWMNTWIVYPQPVHLKHILWKDLPSPFTWNGNVKPDLHIKAAQNTGCFFHPPKKLKYGKPRLGESTLT